MLVTVTLRRRPSLVYADGTARGAGRPSGARCASGGAPASNMVRLFARRAGDFGEREQRTKVTLSKHIIPRTRALRGLCTSRSAGMARRMLVSTLQVQYAFNVAESPPFRQQKTEKQIGPHSTGRP